MSEAGQVTMGRPGAALVPALRGAFWPFFHEHALRTARIVRLLEDGDLGLRPAEGSMSAGEQINHICACYNFVARMFEGQVDRAAFERKYDVSSVGAAIGSMRSAIEDVKQAFEKMPTPRWDEEVAPFGPEWAMTCGQMAYLFVEHEVHHAGQLHVYARMAGKVPPFLYHLVDQSILEA